MKRFAAVLCTLMMGISVVQVPVHAQGGVVKATSVIKATKKTRKGVQSLGTNNEKLYKYLVKKVNAIDHGSTSSTLINVPMSVFGMNKTVTKKQLGVSKLTKNGYVPTTVETKLLKYLKIDISAVMEKLYYSIPEMYWYDYYDQRWTLSNASNYRLQCYVTANSIRYYTKSGSIQIKMAVGREYGSNYKVSNTGRTLFSLAKDNAKRIVSAASGLSDYNKIMYYKNIISQITAYDNDAMTHYKKSQIAQWELINVFDGDANTKVVCEGYAKAFQYLCNLTKWTSNTYSEMVSGQVKAGSDDAYAHMWNIVHYNGNNYVVDVTNCDTDDANVSENYLFMVANSSNVTTSYTIPVTINNSLTNVTYAYDNDTLVCYKTSDLKLATSNYTSTEVLSAPEVHVYNLGKTIKKATLTSTGQALQTCEICGATRTVTLSKLKIGTPTIKKAYYVRSRKIYVSYHKGSYNKTYQVSYRLKGSSKWKSVNTTSTKKTIKNLKRKKYYYIRVRGINGSVKSSWSGSKKIYVKS